MKVTVAGNVLVSLQPSEQGVLTDQCAEPSSSKASPGLFSHRSELQKNSEMPINKINTIIKRHCYFSRIKTLKQTKKKKTLQRIKNNLVTFVMKFHQTRKRSHLSF